ncbi:MAG TPA: PDZ domain-containing protein [Candidatus Rubrimentiphilum sp.]|nr:PDZ domain-containing protein [Candidatus Rubrimentiphilum sp.]
MKLARNRVAIYAALAVAALICAFAPTPYSLILPGRALDLGDVVSLAGLTSQSHVYLTDVRFATRVTPLELLSAFTPGVRIVRTGDVLPSGFSPAQYDNVERDAMSESQMIAAAVAERAAGYRVPAPRSRVLILSFSARSDAARVLRPFDVIVSIDGTPVATGARLASVMRPIKAGTIVTVGVMRRGLRRTVSVRTGAYRGRTVLGTYLTTIVDAPHLPVAVRYNLPHVAGSSGGLMFALEIYRSLKRDPLPATLRIAGTGTIAYDGTVGPIEGAAQKIAAARAADASLFLVPAENYAEVKDTPGIHVVPVTTFSQALKAVASATIPQ